MGKLKKRSLVTVNGFLYEFVENARSWKGHLCVCRSLITEEAVVQIPEIVFKAKDSDILKFLDIFIQRQLDDNN